MILNVIKEKKKVSAKVIFLLTIVVLSGCANLEILSQQLSETVVKTDGEDDYSIKYTVLLRNKGTAAKIRAKAKLYTPEGQFYREEIIKVNSDTVLELGFIFTEPTFLGALFGEGKTNAEFSYDIVE